jgi:hypothetical protein
MPAIGRIDRIFSAGQWVNIVPAQNVLRFTNKRAVIDRLSF